MMPAEQAVARCRRDLAISTVLRSIMLGAIVVAVFLGGGLGAPVMLVGVGGVWMIWMILNYRSMQTSQLTAAVPSLIATGDFQSAEARLAEAIQGFSLFRTVKLMSLHQLAVLRHAQRRWRDAAVVAEGVLGQRLGAAAGIGPRSRLVLADSLLEMDDLRGAWQALVSLHQQRLSLAEAMNLTLLQLDYQSRIGDWAGMLLGAGHKVQMAEIMPAAPAARTLGLLALAAQQLGQQDKGDYLRRRAELLADPRELCEHRPVLKALWPESKPDGEDGGPDVGAGI